MNFMFDLNEYTTVAERIKLFRQGHPMGRIITYLVAESSTHIVMKAELYRDDEDTRPFSTGYAKEVISERGVNRDFALENCETSAIGIACKNANIGTEKHAISREEAAKVNKVKETQTLIQQTKAKLAETSKEYIPVPKEDDPWTIREGVPVVTMEQAVETVKTVLGGTTENDIQRCRHGEMIWKTGTGKNGKQWAHFRCPEQSTRSMPGGEIPCDPIWYEIGSDGKWKQQVKR
jgi:hypothetical protein